MGLFTLKKNNGIDFDPDFFRDQYAVGNQEHDIPMAETRFLGKYIPDKKLSVFLGCMLVFMSVLFAKAIYIQIVKGNYYHSMADTNRLRTTPITSPRGLIYDRQHQPLVRNVPIFDARVIPSELPFKDDERTAEIGHIADILHIAPQTIADALAPYKKNYKYPVTVVEHITYEQALDLKIKSADDVALIIDTRNQRQYLERSFSHVIGYEGRITADELQVHPEEDYLYNDRIGKNGLELSYEPVLRGQYGFVQTEINVKGQAEKVVAQKEPQSGGSLVLAIDSAVQKKADEILRAHLQKIGKKRGVVVMLDPRTGEVIALVSTPDYDDNLFASGISTADYQALIDNPDKPLFDRTTKGEYPSGSTVKILESAGALQDGIITDRTTVNSVGGIRIQDKWFFPDWKAGGHGLTNVYKAIAWSVNTFFYEVGGGYKDFKGLGEDGLKKWFELGGLGSPTGIDLPGESAGLVPDEAWKIKSTGEQWYIGDTYHMAIGQGGVLVTPIQVAQYTSLFADGGILY
ncbi:MAG TPA: penicillin-binding transpeptidase domain-containing protein, partial [Candidatus Sulfotelmatobacter sp.]|nr:penicillin-binding transpeptidase domain-containing protein [Candidatus Sulfotelmatobacter sp.]